MRLIDDDALIEAIKNMSQRYCDCKDCDGKGQIIRVSEVIDIVKNEVPTAYSVDRVIEEIKANGRNTDVCIIKVKAIEIVKKGGVADDVCEWKSDCHLENDNPAEWLISPHNPKRIFSTDIIYCPYCGKKIKVVQ